MSKNSMKKTSFYGKLLAGLFIGIAVIGSSLLLGQKPAVAADIVVYKSPTCGCCKNWVKHMEDNGYSVEVHNERNLAPIKSSMGVPKRLQSCHTAKVGDYVIEGHVPANDVKRLLKDKPQIAGLATPGMPMGSPGMEGPRKDAYQVIAFKKDGSTGVYASYIQR
jgi:hypothetical protein